MSKGSVPVFRAWRGSERGQAMVEFAIIMPLVLFLLLGLVQLSLIFVARSVMSYASFMATRAELVGRNPEQAARTVLSVIAGPTMLTGEKDSLEIPGWGKLPRYDSAAEKTRVTVISPRSDRPGIVCVEVQHDFELILPDFVAPILTHSSNSTFKDSTKGGASFITLSDRYALSKTWEGL